MVFSSLTHIVEGRDVGIGAGLDNVGVGACAPVHFTLFILDADVGGGGGAGVSLLDAVLGVDLQHIIFAGVCLQGIADGVQRTVAPGGNGGLPAVTEEGDLGLHGACLLVELRAGNRQGVS